MIGPIALGVRGIAPILDAAVLSLFILLTLLCMMIVDEVPICVEVPLLANASIW